MRKADQDPLVGRTIAGKYVVQGLIGSGAMGAVFRARQVALEKTVAIKVMHADRAADPSFATRFHREAKAASRLNHPNSIQILDFGAESDGLLYIAMEYLDGRTLHKVLRDEWPLAPARVADILMQTLAALAIAHDMGVVHRDLKPENIMVLSGTDDDGRPRDIVKVCDFGIAKITDPRAYNSAGECESVAPVTTAGFLVGTPEYMSPEQGRGERLDPRSDLYSVGVILFEMLTGRVPFIAENAIGIVLKHITEEPEAPSRLVAGVDPRLETIALRALRKFREERHPNARDMRAELRLSVEDARADHPVAASVEATPQPGDRPSLVGVGVGVGMGMGVGAATLALPTSDASSSYGTVAKPTLEGTEAAVVRLPSRRRNLLVGAVLLVVSAGATGTALVLRRSAHPAAASSPATAMAVAPPVGTAAPTEPTPTVASTSDSESEPGGPPPGPTSVGGGPHPTAVLRAPVRARGAAGAPSIATALTAPVSAPPGASKAAVVPEVPVVVPPPAAPPVPSTIPSEASTPVARAAPNDVPVVDPTFDPARAYVEVGMINTEGVKERAVRGAMHGVPLAQCYRTALRSNGARASGIATLTLSFDEGGLARSAIITGADFLRGLARCVQTASTGIRIGSSQLDSAGGIAEVTLDFREP